MTTRSLSSGRGDRSLTVIRPSRRFANLFVFGSVANLPGPVVVPYFIFAFGGRVVFTLFTNVANRATFAPTANSALVSRTCFPRLLLPLSTLVSALVDASVAVAMLGVMLGIEGIWAGWQLLTTPRWLLLALLFGLGIGMVAGAYVVRYRDVGFVLPVTLQFALYVSPVAYTLDAVPGGIGRTLFSLNPLVAGFVVFAERERKFADVI